MYTQSKTYKPNKPNWATGFSLVEMAISLTLLGFLLSGILKSLPIMVTNQRQHDTIALIDSVTQSITGYILINQELPCPDVDGDGVGNLDVDGTCISNFGTLPFAELGVGRYDGWDNPFNYAVTNSRSANNLLNNLGSGFEIKNSSVDVTLAPALYPAVIWSSGTQANNTIDEQENRNNDMVFVNAYYVRYKFDDIVRGIPLLPILHNLNKSRLLPNNTL